MAALVSKVGHNVLQPQAFAAGPQSGELIAGGAIAAAAVAASELSRPPGWRLGRLTADFPGPALLRPLTLHQGPRRRCGRVVAEEVSVRP
jgi:hypothetical protein